jgi:hypothetical protein
MNKIASIICIVFLACEPPSISTGADKRQNSRAGLIEGNLIVSSTSRGNAVLFLYDAARPPPPSGTGRPVTFTTVGQRHIFGTDTTTSGPFSARFSFPLVNPGRYLIRAFIDSNADFIPWYSVTSDVNAGDIGGGAVDAARNFRVIEVGVDEAGIPRAVADVGVSISDAAKVPIDRPVFEVLGGQNSVTLSLAPTAIELALKPIVEGVIFQASPIFLARLVDDNNDGAPDDTNRDGIPDFWPRVVVRKIAAEGSVLVDENDKDKNGILDAEGFTDYEHVNADMSIQAPDGSPDAVVLAAGFDFTSLLPQLLDSNGKVKLTPTPVAKLKLVIRPVALDASNPSKPAPLRRVPAGKYAITVIQSTGQSWRVPNELSADFATNLGLPTAASQSFVVEAP